MDLVRGALQREDAVHHTVRPSLKTGVAVGGEKGAQPH